MGIAERRARLFQQREAEILGAALDLFRRDDWQSVTIEQIAAHAEVGKGTIYKHFASKDEIYARLAIDFQLAIVDQLMALGPDQDVLDYLRAVVRVYWEAHTTSRERHRLFQYCHQDDFRHKVSEATQQRLDSVYTNMMEPIDAALRRGIAAGLFPDRPLPLLVFGAQVALQGAVDRVWTGCGCTERPESYLEEVTRFILAGLMHQDDDDVRGGVEPRRGAGAAVVPAVPESH